MLSNLMLAQGQTDSRYSTSSLPIDMHVHLPSVPSQLYTECVIVWHAE